jgi:hypothetical protein
MHTTLHSITVLAFLLAASSYADDGERLLSVDHYVRVHSTVPAIAGQTTQIYVREVRITVGWAFSRAPVSTCSPWI